MNSILGIGNALVDVIVQLNNESLLENFNLKKGGMSMIDCNKKREIHQAIQELPQTYATGGSTSNTIHGLARLGIKSGFIGKLSDDHPGNFFKSEMKKYGITPHILSSKIDTGIATTLMTKDAERTFATYLGAAETMTAEELDIKIFKDYNYILIEGYLIFNHDLILKACQLAKECNMKIAMDMASYNVVEYNRDFIIDILKNYVDIVFANEDEAKALTGKTEKEALEIMSQYCPIAVVKIGSRGSMVKMNGMVTNIAPVKANCIDTNGAGDIYAAGFLYGIMNGFSAEKSGSIASLLSAKLVETVGAKLHDEQWEVILHNILC